MNDIARIHDLSNKQAELRRLLKSIDPKCHEARNIRREMYFNRRGRNGLRALNKRLYDTSLKKRRRGIIYL